MLPCTGSCHGLTCTAQLLLVVTGREDTSLDTSGLSQAGFQVASLCHQADHVKTRHARPNGLPCDATAKPYPSSSKFFIPGAGSASPASQLTLVLRSGSIFNVTSPIT
jgi:hypothetical protein